ncbi:hypothetical protein ABPG72_011604 [Tetrahymena utriculariae]
MYFIKQIVVQINLLQIKNQDGIIKEKLQKVLQQQLQERDDNLAYFEQNTIQKRQKQRRNQSLKVKNLDCVYQDQIYPFEEKDFLHIYLKYYQPFRGSIINVDYDLLNQIKNLQKPKQLTLKISNQRDFEENFQNTVLNILKGFLDYDLKKLSINKKKTDDFCQCFTQTQIRIITDNDKEQNLNCLIILENVECKFYKQKVNTFEDLAEDKKDQIGNDDNKLIQIERKFSNINLKDLVDIFSYNENNIQSFLLKLIPLKKLKTEFGLFDINYNIKNLNKIAYASLQYILNNSSYEVNIRCNVDLKNIERTINYYSQKQYQRKLNEKKEQQQDEKSLFEGCYEKVKGVKIGESQNILSQQADVGMNIHQSSIVNPQQFVEPQQQYSTRKVSLPKLYGLIQARTYTPIIPREEPLSKIHQNDNDNECEFVIKCFEKDIFFPQQNSPEQNISQKIQNYVPVSISYEGQTESDFSEENEIQIESEQSQSIHSLPHDDQHDSSSKDGHDSDCYDYDDNF